MPDVNSGPDPSSGLPEAFLRALGERFRFDAQQPGMRRELDDLACRYKRDVGIIDNAEPLDKERKSYRKLREQVDALRQMLGTQDFEALDAEIYLALRLATPRSTESGISRLPVPSGAVGEHLLRLLDELLSLVSQTAVQVEERNAPLPGRKRNYSLENLVRRIAYLWVDILNRPFTLDYHKGSGVTEAFAFAKMIVGVVDPEVAETNLITATRKIVSEKNFVPPTKQI